MICEKKNDPLNKTNYNIWIIFFKTLWPNSLEKLPGVEKLLSIRIPCRSHADPVTIPYRSHLDPIKVLSRPYMDPMLISHPDIMLIQFWPQWRSHFDTTLTPLHPILTPSYLHLDYTDLHFNAITTPQRCLPWSRVTLLKWVIFRIKKPFGIKRFL